MENKSKNERYWEAVRSNIGIITEEEQNILFRSTVAVAGCGGMGGQSIPQLIRWGIGGIKIADFDSFERGNFNRQFHAYEDTINKQKTAVVMDEMLRINPYLNFQCFGEGITEKNAEVFVEDANIVIDAIDYTCLPASIALHRAARKHERIVLTAQAIGFGANVFTFVPDGITLEEYVGLPVNIELEAIKDYRIPLNCFCPIYPEYVDSQVAIKAANGEIAIPNVASAQALGAGMMVMEAILLILGKVKPLSAPEFISLDIFSRRFDTINK